MKEKTSGFCNDDGSTVGPEPVEKPGLCILCKNDETGGKKEQVLCLVNRNDQKGHITFECDAYVPKHNYE
jgi:hypothetical protein